MSTLYIDRKNAKVSLKNHALCLKATHQSTQRIPLYLLQRIVISCDVDLSSRLLCELAQEGISTLILIPRKKRGRAFILGEMHNDIHIRLKQYACMQSQPFCLAFSQFLIRAKLLGQQQLLQRVARQQKKQRYVCKKAITQIKAQRKDIAQSTNLQSLMGLEGAAAHAYFKAYSSFFAPSLNMTGRNRRPPKDPVNACLSLAYTLIHFEAVHGLHAAGLDVMGGLFHQPQFGRESLACDVIEPLRPKVDAFVLELFHAQQLRAEHFSTHDNCCMLQKAGRHHFYQAYETWAPPIRRWMRFQCRQLVNHIKAHQL